MLIQLLNEERCDIHDRQKLLSHLVDTAITNMQGIFTFFQGDV